MSEYSATIRWTRGAEEPYTDNQYSRGHTWTFDGGETVPASSSPHIVPTPYSVESHVDPEEAFVASLSSCHMLFFLSIAAKRRFVVDEYLDRPVGTLEKDGDGKMAMTRVVLRPKATFSGDRRPSRAVLEKMHHQSHESCFLANSVKTQVVTDIDD